MQFQWNCPHCRKPFRVHESMVGKVVKCAHCQGTSVVPNPDPSIKSASESVAPPPLSKPQPASTVTAENPAFQAKTTSIVAPIQQRQFRALEFTARWFEIFADVAVAFGALLVILQLLSFVSNSPDPDRAMEFWVRFVVVAVGCAIVAFYTIFCWVALKGAAEMIRLMIHLEHNTHTAAEATWRTYEIQVREEAK